MATLKTYAPVALIAIWMLGGGVAHFLYPASFHAIVPDVFPKNFVVYTSSAVEICIGLAILIPKFRAAAGLAFAALCLGFLPLHLWDFVRPDPVFTPIISAVIRVAVQFLLIWIGWRVWQRGTKTA